MAWKKYFKDANMSPISGEKVPNFAKRNYSSYLPDVYTGHPNRIQRYFQYDQMDSDSEINAALDILAEFSTQLNTENETPFDIVFHDESTDHEVKLLKKHCNNGPRPINSRKNLQDIPERTQVRRLFLRQGSRNTEMVVHRQRQSWQDRSERIRGQETWTVCDQGHQSQPTEIKCDTDNTNQTYGGSGGGGSIRETTAGGLGNTPPTSPSQGNNGGTGAGSPNYGGGGGGGASAVGSNGTTSNGGAGGNGTASSITGSSVTYAGGGGGATYLSGSGGSGGSGGGGAGGSGGAAGVNGTINLGGGGGGAGANDTIAFKGGDGGKGVVIISVPTGNYSSTTTGSPYSYDIWWKYNN